MTASLSDPRRPLVEARGVHRALGHGAAERTILRDVSLTIARGEFVAVTGSSGSGKSTLLYLLGALDRASSGEIWMDDVELGALDDDDRAAFRNEKLGFVFQFHFLLPEFTALENVAIPMMRRGALGSRAIEERAYETLDRLGLGDLAERLPSQLSGGEQQRLSIARAIANGPSLVLADEPTGNLDSANARRVVDTFERLSREHGCTVVMVTHDAELAGLADRRIVLRDGRIVSGASS